MCCKNCETQIVEDSDFCPEDGVMKSPDCAQNSKKKAKPFYKEWWVWTIAGATTVISIAVLLTYRKDKRLYKKVLDRII
jgi:hypothetical protein